MGVFTATARNLFVCASFFLFYLLTVPSRPVWAQSLLFWLKAKSRGQYDEKKRQATISRNGHGVRHLMYVRRFAGHPERQ